MKTYISNINPQELAHSLFQEQKQFWPLLHDNTQHLNQVRVRTLEFQGFTLNVQYNPKRITSSAAKIDQASIAARPCFLCAANRPKEQKSVLFGQSWEILCNPFPIFPEHFTIAHTQHIPQEIGQSFTDFLDISKALPDNVTFYNAPNCGASAPDHLHFQAGNRGFLPIEKDFETLKNQFGKELKSKLPVEITAIDDTLRRMLVLESDNKEALMETFKPIYQFMKNLTKGNEPDLNILSWYANKWRVVIFPRGKHRPWQYFAEGDENILLSPASVDLGGTLITPLEKDFEKITAKDATDIFHQVFLPVDIFNQLIKSL